MPLLHTLFSLDLMEKPSGTFGLQSKSHRSTEGPTLDFLRSTACPVFTEAQEHGRCSGCLSEGLFLYLKMEWNKGQKIGEYMTINGENPIPCWQEYFVSHGYFLLNTELL